MLYKAEKSVPLEVISLEKFSGVDLNDEDEARPICFRRGGRKMMYRRGRVSTLSSKCFWSVRRQRLVSKVP